MWSKNILGKVRVAAVCLGTSRIQKFILVSCALAVGKVPIVEKDAIAYDSAPQYAGVAEW
jgi:hypothetical protein